MKGKLAKVNAGWDRRSVKEYSKSVRRTSARVINQKRAAYVSRALSWDKEVLAVASDAKTDTPRQVIRTTFRGTLSKRGGNKRC